MGDARVARQQASVRFQKRDGTRPNASLISRETLSLCRLLAGTLVAPLHLCVCVHTSANQTR